MSDEADTPTPPAATPPVAAPGLVDTDRTPPRRKVSRGPVPRLEVMELLEDSLIDFGVDTSSLDPEMHYYLAHERDQRMAKLRGRLGYRPVSRSEDGVRMRADAPNDAQGAAEDLVRVGDTILMCCPKEMWEERRKKGERLAAARLSAPEASFRRRARKDQVDLVEDDGRIKRVNREGR